MTADVVLRPAHRRGPVPAARRRVPPGRRPARHPPRRGDHRDHVRHGAPPGARLPPFRQGQGRRRPEPRDPGRHVRHAARPIGLRQEHDAQPDRRPRPARRRAGSTSATRTSPTTPPNERRMAMVFQNYALYPHMTAYDNIAFGLKLQHRPKAEIDVAREGGRRDARHRAPPEAQAGPAVGRPAAARRARPGAREGAARLPPRRAVLEPRRRRCAPGCARRSSTST